jgi:branched-chain amino acid transport system substrate-binding protein
MSTLKFKNKFLIGALSLWIISLMLLSGCGGAATPTEELAVPKEEEAAPMVEESAPPEVEPIIIGSSAHLSGWMATYDLPPRQGVLLAIKTINENGGILGRPVEFIELDGQTDAAVLARVTQQLIDEGADVLVAPCDFDFGAAAAMTAQENGIVAISTCASSPLYGSEALGDLQFTMSMWNTTETAVAAEFAYNVKGWRTAYMITETATEFTVSLADLFEKSWEHVGGEVLANENYTTGDMDASALIQRFQSLPEPADLIWVSVNMPDVGAIVRQFRAAGIDTPVMGGDSMDNEEFYAAVGDEHLNNIYMIQHSWIFDDSADPKMGDFIELWNEEYGEPPEYAYCVMGWDVIYAFKAGIEEAGTTEGKALAKALEELAIPGLSGTMDWTSAEDGHKPNKEAFVLEVQGGEISFVYKTMPEWLPEY